MPKNNDFFTPDELDQYFDLARLYCSTYLKSFVEQYNQLHPQKQVDYQQLSNHVLYSTNDQFIKEFQQLSIMNDSSVWFKNLFNNGLTVDTKDVKTFFKKLVKNHPHLDIYSIVEYYRNFTLYHDAVTKHNYPAKVEVVYDFCKRYLKINTQDTKIKKTLQLLHYVDIDNRFISYIDEIYTNTNNAIIKNNIEDVVDKLDEELKKLSVVSKRAKQKAFSHSMATIYRTQFVIDKQILMKEFQFSAVKAIHFFELIASALDKYIQQHYIQNNNSEFFSNQYTYDSTTQDYYVRYESLQKDSIEKIAAFFNIIEDNISIVLTQYQHNKDSNMDMLALINTIVLKNNLDKELLKDNDPNNHFKRNHKL